MPHSPSDSGHLSLRALPTLLIPIVLWAAGPLFIKYFAAYYNAWTQNAFRYTVAAATLLGLAFLRGQLRPGLTRGQWGKLVLVAAANLAMQINFVAVFYFIYPAVASLVGRLNIVFVALLSFLIFHDERRIIKSPRFLCGASLAVAGAVPVILARDPELLAHLNVSEADFWMGVTLTVGHAFFVSVYFLTIKHAVRDVPPLVSFTHVSWMTALGLLLPALAVGGLSDLWRQPPMPLAMMAVSALLCIVISHTCYYAALRQIKTVVSTSMLQLIPVFTCLFSALVYGDRLSPLQLAGGAVVITGAWLAGLAQARVGSDQKDEG